MALTKNFEKGKNLSQTWQNACATINWENNFKRNEMTK